MRRHSLVLLALALAGGFAAAASQDAAREPPLEPRDAIPVADAGKEPVARRRFIGEKALPALKVRLRNLLFGYHKTGHRCGAAHQGIAPPRRRS